MLTSDNPEMVIQTLQKKFGRPDCIIKNVMEKVRSTSSLKEGEFHTLMAFADNIRHYVAIIKKSP